jgi:sporulation protein YlmC with PRC-barrel domain
MLIEKSNLVGLPVFELENQTRVALLVDFFIDEAEIKIDAAIVKTDGLISHQKYISAHEIADISRAALIAQNEDSLVEPTELVRLYKNHKKRARIVGERVYTKKGEFLGTVFDYVIESGSLAITRIYLKKLFDQRIIHSSAIIKIEQHKIIVKDNFEMVKPEIVPMGATELA